MVNHEDCIRRSECVSISNATGEANVDVNISYSPVRNKKLPSRIEELAIN